MANEILFAGGRLDSLVLSSGAATELTTAGRFDSSYCDASVNIQDAAGQVDAGFYTQSGGVLSAATVVSGETLWVHVDTYGGGYASSGSNSLFICIRDSSGFPWLALKGLNGGGNGFSAGLYYNSGTGASPTWTLIGTVWTKDVGAIVTWDLELTLGSPHSINLYKDGALFRNGTFTQASFTNAAKMSFTGWHNSTGTGYSQMLATRGISTIGAKVKTSRATAAGANTGWTGSYASVNEAVGSDANLQNAATAGLKSTHAMGDVTVPSGFEIKSVFHWMRAKNDGTGPTKIKSVLRHSGADYATADLSGIGLGYGPIGARYDADPLATNWTQTTWNAIEAGYESAT